MLVLICHVPQILKFGDEPSIHPIVPVRWERVQRSAPTRSRLRNTAEASRNLLANVLLKCRAGNRDFKTGNTAMPARSFCSRLFGLKSTLSCSVENLQLRKEA